MEEARQRLLKASPRQRHAVHAGWGVPLCRRSACPMGHAHMLAITACLWVMCRCTACFLAAPRVSHTCALPSTDAGGLCAAVGAAGVGGRGARRPLLLHPKCFDPGEGWLMLCDRHGCCRAIGMVAVVRPCLACLLLSCRTSIGFPFACERGRAGGLPPATLHAVLRPLRGPALHLSAGCVCRWLASAIWGLNTQLPPSNHTQGVFFLSCLQVAFAVGAQYEPGNGFMMVGAHTDRWVGS